MELAGFLIGVVTVSLSGVMMPGPITAATLVMGSRDRYAGALMAVGHGVVEFPLIALLMLGMDSIFNSAAAQVVIGLAGGVFLLVMAIQMLKSLRDLRVEGESRYRGGPFVTGIVLSAGNPYFLVWWATVGLSLATRGKELGVWALGLFAVVHWLCDLVWLSILSWASFKGAEVFGGRGQRVVMLICAGALVIFGVLFIHGAVMTAGG